MFWPPECPGWVEPFKEEATLGKQEDLEGEPPCRCWVWCLQLPLPFPCLPPRPSLLFVSSPSDQDTQEKREKTGPPSYAPPTSGGIIWSVRLRSTFALSSSTAQPLTKSARPLPDGLALHLAPSNFMNTAWALFNFWWTVLDMVINCHSNLIWMWL